MTPEEVTESEVNHIWNQCEMSDDVELLSGIIARGVRTPWGYGFVNQLVVAHLEQVNEEKAERYLDRKTEESIRYLISKGKADGYLD